MGKESKLAQLGILHILNQMKNPLTNIRLCVEMLDKQQSALDNQDCRDIIKKNAISLEASIRDLCNSFSELGVTIHLENDVTSLENSNAHSATS